MFWGICDLSTILGILIADGQSCGPISPFGMRCLALKPAGSWMELCLGVRMGTQVRRDTVGLWLKFFFSAKHDLKIGSIVQLPSHTPIFQFF